MRNWRADNGRAIIADLLKTRKYTEDNQLFLVRAQAILGNAASAIAW